MTKLKNKVVRETGALFDGAPVVIELEAPGTVGFRRKGSAKIWPADVAWLMQIVVQREVENQAQIRGRRRRVTRSLLRGR